MNGFTEGFTEGFRNSLSPFPFPPLQVVPNPKSLLTYRADLRRIGFGS